MDQQPSLDATLDSANQGKTIVQQFRQAWKQGQPPILSKIAAEIPNAESTLLAELIAVDLEQRLAHGQAVRLEDYLQQFPAVARDEGLVLTLIEQEYALRSSADSTINSNEYLNRFPKYREKLSSLFESRATRVRDQTASWGTGGFANETHPNIQYEIPAAKVPTKIGRFNVRRWLGSGAFGDVYEAHDPQLDREVAIKVAKLQRGDTELRIKRFLREAKSAAGLRHPNIVPVYEFGQDGELFYIASAYIRGQSLKERGQGGKSIDVAAGVRVTRLLAEALAYSHSQGIIHRDLKPANIMLDEAGTPLLMDFGLASRLDEAEELTQTGQQLGTPLYMSPEQARGKTGATLPASDQYSLGVILYELITGRPPFTGTVEMLMYHQQATEPPPPRQFNRSISRDLETVCLKCLQKAPEKRYPTMADLADDLRRVETGDPIRARREGIATRFLRRIRRNPIVSAAVVLIVVSALVSAWVWQASQGQREQARIDRRVAELRTSAQQLLANPKLEPAYLDEADRLLSDMERMQPNSSGDDRKRLVRAYADHISETFRDRLLEEEVEPIDQALVALQLRDAKLATAVRSEFRQRQSAWSPRLTLASPFANLDEVFDAKGYRLEVTAPGTAVGRAPTVQSNDTYVESKIPGRATLKVVATFDPSWKESKSRIAIALPGGKGQHYTFTLGATDEFSASAPAPLSFAEHGRRGLAATLSIDRTQATQTDVVAIREYAVEDIFASSENGSLRMEVRREGSHLFLSINQLPVIEFEDAIPLRASTTAKLAFNWSSELKLHSLATFERSLPEVASELETADESFNRGEYDEALRHYQDAVATLENEAARDECQYKQGLCFLAMDDRPNAIEKFTYVANRLPSGSDQLPRWTIRANCQLLRHFLSERTPSGHAEASRILDRLNLLRGDRRAEIPPLISAKERTRMVYDAAGTGISIYLRTPEALVDNCERVDRVADLIGTGSLDRMYAKVTLIRAHRLAGNLERALQTTTEWIADNNHCHADTAFGKDIFAEHVWILLEQQASPERLATALKDVDRWLYASAAKTIRQERNRSARDLLIERAHLLAALNRTQEAEACLELFLAESDNRKPDQVAPKYTNYAEACLLLGFLRDRRGDHGSALATWKKAIWRDSRSEFFGLSQFPENGAPILQHMVLTSLTSDPGDFDGQRMLMAILTNRQGQGGSNQLMNQLTKLFNLTPKFVERAWTTEAGKAWAQRIAFRELSYEQFTRVPIYLIMAEYVRVNAYEGALPADHEELVTKFVDESIEQYQLGKLTDAKIILLGSIWQAPFLPGAIWLPAAPTLPNELRAHSAVLFGQRFLSQKRRGDALIFFKDALSVATEGSKVHAVALAGVKLTESKETPTPP